MTENQKGCLVLFQITLGGVRGGSNAPGAGSAATPPGVPDAGPDATAQVTSPAQAAELIDRLRAANVTLIYDPATRTLRTDTKDSLVVSIS